MLALLFAGVWMPGPAASQAREPDSVVEIPVRVPLGPLFAEIERFVPVEVRRDREWREVKGVKVRYAARRGPLEIQARRDTLFLRATVAYWLQARKPILGRMAVNGSCGIDEPPRAVVLGLAVRLGIAPDWRLVAQPVVTPPTFLAPCEMTALDIDVTDIVRRVLHEQLWRAAEEGLGAGRAVGQPVSRPGGDDSSACRSGCAARVSSSTGTAMIPPNDSTVSSAMSGLYWRSSQSGTS